MITIKLDEKEINQLILIITKELFIIKQKFNKALEINDIKKTNDLFIEYNKLFGVYVKLMVEKGRIDEKNY